MNFTLVIFDIFILRCYIVDTRKYGRILPLDESKARLRKFGNYFLFEKATHIIMNIEVRTAKVVCSLLFVSVKFPDFYANFVNKTAEMSPEIILSVQDVWPVPTRN